MNVQKLSRPGSRGRGGAADGIRAGIGLALSLLLPACGVGGGAGTPAVMPMMGGGGNPPPVALSFAQNVWPILQSHCVVCHGPGGQSSGILLMDTAAATLGRLVNQSSSQMTGGCAQDIRVVPGSPQVSLLYEKVAFSQAMLNCGSTMPLGGPSLSAADQMTIHDWILEGANP